MAMLFDINNTPYSNTNPIPVIMSGTANTGPVSNTIVQLQDGSVPTGAPFTATAVGVLFTADTLGYSSIAVQISGTFVGTVIYEASNDNATWFAIAGNGVGNTGTLQITSLDTGTVIRTFPVTARYFRARVLAYTSGTVVAAPILRAIQDAKGAVYVGGGSVTLAGSTASIGFVAGINTTTAAGGIALVSKLVSSAATANPNLVKNTGGRVYKIVGYNASTSIRWLKLFNGATTPTPGTTVPIFQLPLLPSTSFNHEFGIIGYYFSAGIGYTITTGPADLDTTALTAGDILNMNVMYA